MIVKSNKNTLTAYGTIWNGDGREFIAELSRLEQEYTDITVHLHTQGGSVFDGNLIYNAINKSKSVIHIVVDGIAASMGAIITLSANKVSIVENGYFMIHAPSSYSGGSADTFEKQAKLLRSIEKNFIEKLSARTGKPVKEVARWLVGDNWFDAQEAKRLGLVTDIIPARTATLLPVDNPSNRLPQDVYNAYASLLCNLKNVNINLIQNMKQTLISALALQSVTAESSDTAVIQAVQELLDNEKKARLSAENELDAFRKEQIKAVIEGAVKDGKIKDGQKEVFQKIAETSGVESLGVVLDSIKAANTRAPNIGELLKGKSGVDARTNWDFDQWQKEDPKALEKMSVEDPERFKKLFNGKYKK